MTAGFGEAQGIPGLVVLIQGMAPDTLQHHVGRVGGVARELLLGQRMRVGQLKRAATGKAGARAGIDHAVGVAQSSLRPPLLGGYGA
ncbi:hypothetical protein GCM10023186_44980 [Hymenobacter koreensis]|uniref:Uncharacterized protein n=1 Tax=Hymenobacter koreensis TaxID=1084523 RepID=A0ABP8JN40_9BACT